MTPTTSRTFVVLIVLLVIFASACGGKRTRVATPSITPTHSSTAPATWPVAEVREFSITGQPPVVEDQGSSLVYPGDVFPTLNATLEIKRVPASPQQEVVERVEPSSDTRVIDLNVRVGKKTQTQGRLQVLTSWETIQEIYPEAKGLKPSTWNPGADPVRPKNAPPLSSKTDIFKSEYWEHLQEAIGRFSFNDKTPEENRKLQEKFLEQIRGCVEEDLPPYIRLMVNGTTISERMAINLDHPRLQGTAKKWCAFNSPEVNARVGVIYFCANWGITYTSFTYQADSVRKVVPMPYTYDFRRKLTPDEIRASLRFSLARTLQPPPPPPPPQVEELEETESGDGFCGPKGWKCWVPAAIAAGAGAAYFGRGKGGPTPGLVKLDGPRGPDINWGGNLGSGTGRP